MICLLTYSRHLMADAARQRPGAKWETLHCWISPANTASDILATCRELLGASASMAMAHIRRWPRLILRPEQTNARAQTTNIGCAQCSSEKTCKPAKGTFESFLRADSQRASRDPSPLRHMSAGSCSSSSKYLAGSRRLNGLSKQTFFSLNVYQALPSTTTIVTEEFHEVVWTDATQ